MHHHTDPVGPPETEQGMRAHAHDITAHDLKRIATCRARAALEGVMLTSTEGDDGRLLLIATRWAMTCAFTSINECEAWLDRVCGVGAK